MMRKSASGVSATRRVARGSDGPSRGRKVSGLVVATIAIAIAMVSSNGQESKPTRVKQESVLVNGPELYAGFCAPCHGTGGKGDGPVAAVLKKRTPDLTGLSARSSGSFPAERVRAYIRNEAGPLAHGTDRMPIWGPIFVEVSTLDSESRNKLLIVKVAKGTSETLAEFRVENLTRYIKSIQSSK